MEIEDLRYTAPDIIEGRHGERIISIEPGSQLWDLVKTSAKPFEPPVVPYSERLADWRAGATICLMHVQDALIVAGQFQKAEALSKKIGGHWWIRWRAGAGVFMKRNHPLLNEFAEALHKDGASDWLDGLAGWDMPRPEPEGDE